MVKHSTKGANMKALSKSQIYAILYLKDVNNLQIENIVQELNISQERLQDFLDTDYKQLTKIKKPTSKELMIRETAAKKNNSVAIMTKEASELNDANRDNISRKSASDNPNIYRIR
jgi:hypothetical protein